MEKLRIPSISNYKEDKINDSLNKALIYFENYPQIFWKSPLNNNRKKKGSPYYSSFTFRENNSSEINKLIKNLTRLSLSKFYHMNKSRQNTHIHTDIITINAISFDIYFLRNKFLFRLDLISDKHIFFSFSKVILFCNGSFIVYWTNDRCSHLKMFSNQSSKKKVRKTTVRSSMMAV